MVTLRPHGSGRFFAASFLGLWLCGWLAGECFALWLLANAMVSLMSGADSGPVHLKQGPAVAIGGFVLLWLTVWTIGGIAAMTEFFRLICGEDRVSAESGGLTIERSRGPFHSQREIPRERLRRLLLTGRDALAVETSAGLVEISRLGTMEERQAALESLTAQLKLPEIEPSALAATLPKGWEEIITPEGERAVVPDRGLRRKRARIVGALAAVLAGGTIAVMGQIAETPGIVAFAIQLALGTVAATIAAIWLGRGRMEWRIGSGVVTQRRRFGSGVKDVFEARGFELLLANDRNGNAEWYALDAVADAVAASAPSIMTPLPGKKRKRITSVARDSMIPRQLGAYLARSGNVPFMDRTTPEARAADLALLTQKLGGRGPLGRLAVRLVVESEKRKQAQRTPSRGATVRP
jgi:hypothetical protein